MAAGVLCGHRGSGRQLILLRICRGLTVCPCGLLTRCCDRQGSRGHAHDLQAMRGSFQTDREFVESHFALSLTHLWGGQWGDQAPETTEPRIACCQKLCLDTRSPRHSACSANLDAARADDVRAYMRRHHTLLCNVIVAALLGSCQTYSKGVTQLRICHAHRPVDMSTRAQCKTACLAECQALKPRCACCAHLPGTSQQQQQP